jgi:hypothetical protein
MPWSSVILAFGQLNQPAERVDEPHLLDGAAVNVDTVGKPIDKAAKLVRCTARRP